MLTDQFTGYHWIMFTNGDGKSINITEVIVTADGIPIILKSLDGTSYNWQNVISVK